MGLQFLVLALAASPLTVQAGREAAGIAANPIRRVVTMLQAMQTKVAEEGEAEEALYKKFMCYCKNSGGDLSSSIEAAETKVPELSADIKKTEEQKIQREEDLSGAQVDRTAAKSATAEATAIREKEAAAYAAEKAEYEANIGAISKAVASLEKGMAGAFLQTDAAQVLRTLASGKHSALLEEDREELLSFLAGKQGSGYSPKSGEITGILKEMGDEMAKGLAEATATEEAAIKAFEELTAAKKEEVTVLSAKIESEMTRVGELGVSVQQLKNDLTDTEEALAADKEFHANLEKSCNTKTAEWEERVKTRSDELLALSETIKVLNDDDALDLFKKTLPSPASSFVQVQRTGAALRLRALATLAQASDRSPRERVRLDLIALALRGKKIGFEKVIEMVDNMTEALKVEQQDDDKKKEYCAKQFDLSDDKKKVLERKVSDEETAIAQAEESIATLKEESAALIAGIKKLDKAVAEATEQRKKEHQEYSDLMASDSAAKELIGFAKNRLNKFYNPKLWKPPAKRELSAEDRIAVNLGGGTAPPTPAPGGIAGTGIAVLAQVSEHVQQRREAPGPPPETFGAYTKKSEQNTGVIKMMDMLVADLDKEMTEAETEEKDAQADYEQLMKDSAEKRTVDSKALTEKEATTAEVEADLQEHKDDKASASKELGATLQFIASLHAECDWLLQYFDARKEARASEISALSNAKAVLSGADYSLLQTGSRGSLRGSA